MVETRRGVLLGERRASKTREQGSNPCTPADCCGYLPAECGGSACDFPKVADQVRLLARVLRNCFPRVCRAHGGLRSRKAGFDSRAGDLDRFGFSPRSVTDSHTTLRRSETRFDSWRGHHSFCVTLEPDGQATGCNPVQVGSTPTGVFRLLARPNRPRSNRRPGSSSFPQIGLWLRMTDLKRFADDSRNGRWRHQPEASARISRQIPSLTLRVSMARATRARML